MGIERKAFKHTLNSLPSLFPCISQETRRIWISGIDCQPASTPKTLRDFEVSQGCVLEAQIQVSDNEGTEWTLSKEQLSGSELNRTGVGMGESQTQRQKGKQPVPVAPPRATHLLCKASLQQCPHSALGARSSTSPESSFCSALSGFHAAISWVAGCGNLVLNHSPAPAVQILPPGQLRANKPPLIPVDLGVGAQHAQAPGAQGGVSNTGPLPSYLIYPCLINTEDLKTFLAGAPDRLALRRHGEAEEM